MFSLTLCACFAPKYMREAYRSLNREHKGSKQGIKSQSVPQWATNPVQENKGMQVINSKS